LVQLVQFYKLVYDSGLYEPVSCNGINELPIQNVTVLQIMDGRLAFLVDLACYPNNLNFEVA